MQINVFQNHIEQTLSTESNNLRIRNWFSDHLVIFLAEEVDVDVSVEFLFDHAFA